MLNPYFNKKQDFFSITFFLLLASMKVARIKQKLNVMPGIFFLCPIIF